MKLQAAASQVGIIRAFNRFYTARLGLLRKRHLDGRFSLTEARTLFEIGGRPGVTATALREVLGIDNGYLSRVLAQHVRDGFVRSAESQVDRREKLLTLTATGRREVAQLDALSALQIDEILHPLSAAEQAQVAESLARVQTILAHAERPRVRIERIERMSSAALELIEEYYEALNVIKRDDARAMRRMLGEPQTALWLAYLEGKAVGCVLLRALSQRASAGECKRLYVRSDARGHGVAAALMDALEAHAQAEGMRWVYLDTMRTLKPAVALYRKRGYRVCARYNDNPQATLFLRKRLERGTERLR